MWRKNHFEHGLLGYGGHLAAQSLVFPGFYWTDEDARPDGARWIWYLPPGMEYQHLYYYPPGPSTHFPYGVTGLEPDH